MAFAVYLCPCARTGAGAGMGTVQCWRLHLLCRAGPIRRRRVCLRGDAPDCAARGGVRSLHGVPTWRGRAGRGGVSVLPLLLLLRRCDGIGVGCAGAGAVPVALSGGLLCWAVLCLLAVLLRPAVARTV